jgi:hypothetical protein
MAARKAGMTDDMFPELMAVVGMANETNRLANGYQVPLDDAIQGWLVRSRSVSGHGVYSSLIGAASKQIQLADMQTQGESGRDRDLDRLRSGQRPVRICYSHRLFASLPAYLMPK